MLGTILAYAAGILILFVVCKILALPLKIIWKLIVNALVGVVVLILFNLLGGLINVTIPINALNALITGVLGVPGVILLLILQFLF